MSRSHTWEQHHDPRPFYGTRNRTPAVSSRSVYGSGVLREVWFFGRSKRADTSVSGSLFTTFFPHHSRRPVRGVVFLRSRNDFETRSRSVSVPEPFAKCLNT
jgi:hypothetical protein